MVAAVFHSPPEATAGVPAHSGAIKNIAVSAISTSARGPKDLENTPRGPLPTRAFWLAVLPPLCGFALLLGVWALVSAGTGASIPGPAATWQQARELFADPFYRNGPNDQGVGWNVLASL